MATLESSIALYDYFSPVLNNIMEAMNLTIASVHDLQNSMNGSVDVSTFEAAENAIHQAGAAMESLNRQMRSAGGRVDVDIPNPEPVNVPIHWRVDNMEVFTNSGVERFQQEIQSANAMLNTLSQTQAQITATAGSMDILPPQAAMDMMNMQNRLQAIQQRIRTIEGNPLNLGSSEANAELEQLRMQLANAMNAQNDLNAALQRMDVRAANDAYLRLSGTVGSTERYLRDNVDEQGRFNQQIRDGTTASSGLLARLKKIAGAYIGIQGIKKVIEISDTTAQTEARLSLIVNDGGSVEELQNQIFASAQEARASYQDTASTVAKLGLQAGKAFSGNQEIIEFAELMNKNFTIAGASTQEQTAAMYQLTQAMSAGKLQGDEYRSIIENAPLLANAIEDYMVNVQHAEGSMKEWASEGLLTADVIKSALFSSADEINERFEQMPMTFAQIGTSIKNQALMEFQPVLKRLNDIANSDRFDSMVNGVIGALTILTDYVTFAVDLMISGAALIHDNWSIIGPVFYAIAAAVIYYNIAVTANNIAMGISDGLHALAALKSNIHAAAVARQAGATFTAIAAQYGFNAALLSCPLTWIVGGIILLIGVIYIAVAVFNKLEGTSLSATGLIAGSVLYLVGAFMNGCLVINNLIHGVFAVLDVVLSACGNGIINFGLLIDNIVLGIWEVIKAVAENIVIAFQNAISGAQALFYDLAATALKAISAIATALNKLPFVEFDVSGLDAAAAEYAAKSAEAAGEKNEYKSLSDAWNKGFNTYDYLDTGSLADVSDAWNKGFNTYDYIDLDSEFARGYEWGENLQNKISGMFNKDESQNETTDYSSLLDSLGGIADNTADIADALEITDEDLKYLCDIASREVIDRTVLKSVSIDMSGMVNKVENLQDLDGITTTLEKELRKQMAVSMEGA